MPIGELHATYLFDTPIAAKIAWEKIAKRCRNISVNRWSIDGTPEGGVAVTVLTEEVVSFEFTKAERLARAMAGREVETPTLVFEAMVAKRVRDAEENDGRRRVMRAPGGVVLSHDGRHLGLVRRPQG